MTEFKDLRICHFLPGASVAHRLVAALILPALTACSLSFIDDTGKRVVIGPSLVRSTPTGITEQACNLLHPVEISSLGIAIHSGFGAISGGIGFQRFRDAALRSECPLPSTIEPAADNHASLPRPIEGHRLVLYTSLPTHVRKDSGTVVFVETYGFSIIASETETDITIGYGEVGLAAINNNSLIQGNPIAEIARPHSINGE